MNKKGCGLTAQAVGGLLLSMIVGCLTFFLLNLAVSAILDAHFESGAYNRKKTVEYMDQLEIYVADQQLDADDGAGIEQWLNQFPSAFMMLHINRDGETLFDSMLYEWEQSTPFGALDEYESAAAPLVGAVDANGEEIAETAKIGTEDYGYEGGDYAQNQWFLKREISFADGTATAALYGYFDDWVYDLALATEIACGIFVLCLTFALLCRRKIVYLKQLQEEVKVLETGGLECEVTVKAHDEISALADGLNQMRQVLLENNQEKEAAVRANYDQVASISHDLRTPLTALALYLDLIHEGTYQNREQAMSYLEKSRGKVTQIRQMMDLLFERFYLTRQETVPFDRPERCQGIFEDVLSNLTGYLEMQGFSVACSIAWPDRRVRVSLHYVGRIFDNISSNLLKYADPAAPVELRVEDGGTGLVIFCANRVRTPDDKQESTGIGIDNVRYMMQRMGGECLVCAGGENYWIRLLFPYDGETEKQENAAKKT